MTTEGHIAIVAAARLINARHLVKKLRLYVQSLQKIQKSQPVMMLLYNELAELDATLHNLDPGRRYEESVLVTDVLPLLDEILRSLSRLDELKFKILGSKHITKAEWIEYERELQIAHEKIRELRSQLLLQTLLEKPREITLFTEHGTVDMGVTHKFSHCSFACTCRCHATIRVSISPFPRVLGRLYGTFSQLPRLTCDQSSCVAPTRFSLNLTFTFPAWLLQMSLNIQIERHGDASHGASIRVPRVVDHDHVSFKCAADGNIGLLQTLSQAGECSIHDVDVNGDSLLHVAAREGQLLMCEFLLGVGLDSNLPNADLRTPTDIDFDRWVSRGANEDYREHIYFNHAESLQRRKFSQLHLAVLGLRLTDVETLLQLNLDNSKSHIDDLDIDQRSPLYWAVRKRDLSSTTVLLSYLAEPNAGRSPIAWACKDPCTEPQLLNILLEGGMNPDSHDSDGHTALHACGIYGRDSRFVYALISRGANINTPYDGPYLRFRGITALGFSALYGHSTTLESLLRVGADLGITDFEGRTPVHLAIQSSRKSSRVQCLTTLLEFGANPDVRDRKNRNAANTAMSLQDLDCLELLMSCGADLTFAISSKQGQLRHTAYEILLWPLMEKQNRVVEFLLARVDLHDQDRVTGKTVLHAIAKYGNRTTLVTFENLLDDHGDFSVFPVDQTLYEMNEEMQEQDRFASLLRRLTDRQKASTVATISSKTDASLRLNTTKSMGQSALNSKSVASWSISNDEEHFDAPMRLDQTQEAAEPSPYHEPSFTTSSAPRSEEQQSITSHSGSFWSIPLDRTNKAAPITSVETSVATSTYSQLRYSAEIWHTGDVYAVVKEDDDRDSGYGSDSSEASSAGRSLHVPATVVDSCQPDLFIRRRHIQHTYPFTKSAQMMGTSEDELLAGKRIDEEKTIDTDVAERADADIDPSLRKSRIWRFLEYFIAVMIACLTVVATTWVSLKTAHAAFEKLCRTLMRPKVLPGHTRATWICWCGQEVYADFPGADQSAIRQLQDALRDYDPAPSIGQSNASATLQVPSAAHLGNVSGPSTGRPPGSGTTHPSNIGGTPSTVDSSHSNMVPKFLELCINTGKSCQSLGEIDLTRVTCDEVLFAWIRKKYKEVRGPRKHWIQYLVRPVAMKFVSFGLENREKVHVFQQDMYPTAQHIAAQTWHYWPCPLEPPLPMPSSAFIHHLWYCKDDLGRFTRNPVWLPRLPKKLEESLLRSSEPLAHAFGLHIIEGLNRTAILWTLFGVLVVWSGPLLAYIAITKDVQGVTGIGGLIVATLTLVWMSALVSTYGEH